MKEIRKQSDLLPARFYEELKKDLYLDLNFDLETKFKKFVLFSRFGLRQLRSALRGCLKGLNGYLVDLNN